LRERALTWEKVHGLPDSFDGDKLRVFPREHPVPREEDCRIVHQNWPPIFLIAARSGALAG